MLYKNFIKKIKKCPFCGTMLNRIITKEKYAFMTYSLAPYSKHHLMVIPNRHIENFRDLNKEANKSIEKLIQKGVDMLEKLGYEDYTILMRNGKNSGKSVKHLHYHIIPTVLIGDLDHQGEERKVMSEKEVEEIFEELINL